MSNVIASTSLSVIDGYLQADATKDAAQLAADAQGRADRLSQEQYNQTRQDYAPYLEVATGTPVYGNRSDYEFDLNRYNHRFNAWQNKQSSIESQLANLHNQFKYGEIDARTFYDRKNNLESQRTPEPVAPVEADYNVNEITGREGGALNALAEYGQSKVNPSDYIPDSRIPDYEPSKIGDMPDISSNIPVYSNTSKPVTYNNYGNVSDFNQPSNINAFNVASNVSDFNHRGDIRDFSDNSVVSDFNVRGDIPEYSNKVNLEDNPSYQFRKGEMINAINRNMAGMGKITSGNRLEEIMSRVGEMASQEYEAADARNVRDYGIRRDNEGTRYGRDVTAFDRTRGVEDARYNRGVFSYDRNRSAESDRYGRERDIYGLNRAAEQERYGRGVTSYDKNRDVESDIYDRGVQAYDKNRAAEQERYGRGNYGYQEDYRAETDNYLRNKDTYGINRQIESDTYNRSVSNYDRAYARDADQYGRDVTSYNALVNAEGSAYDRGIDSYNRAYTAEGDYLNRQSSLANIGQTTTGNLANIGANTAQYRGNALVAQGNAMASGRIGTANAWGNAFGNVADAMGRYYYNPQPYWGY